MHFIAGKEKGQGLAEFSLIILVVVIVVILTLMQLGPEVSNWYDVIVEAF
jgi:uncharacterized protein (UPF0333 family)